MSNAITMPTTAINNGSLIEQLEGAAARLNAHMEQIESFQAEYLHLMSTVKADVESMQYFIEANYPNTDNEDDDTVENLYQAMASAFGHLYDSEDYIKWSTNEIDTDCDVIYNLFWHACKVDIPAAIEQLTKLK